jgi:hypothetical protein
MTATSRENQSQLQWGYYLLVFLAGFISFEDFILKWLPGPDSIYFASRFLSEIAIYVALGLVIAKKILNGIPLQRTPLDIPIFFFIAIAILSMVVNGIDVFDALVGFRPICRYFFLFYLIVNLHFTPSQVSKINLTIIGAGVIQAMVGILQFISRGKLDKFLEPRQTETDIGGVQKHFALLVGNREESSIFAATSDTIFFGIFMIIVSLVILNKIDDLIRDYKVLRRKTKSSETFRQLHSTQRQILLMSLIQLLLFIAVPLTFTRSLVIVEFLILAFWISKYLARKIILLILGNMLLLLLVILIIFPPQFPAPQREENFMANFTEIFTIEYLQANLEVQRLSVLLYTIPTVIINKPILGYGPHRETTVEALNNPKNYFFRKELAAQTFKDTYWIYILANYGLAGILAMIWLFYRLYRSSQIIYLNSPKNISKNLALTVKYLVIIFSCLLFLDSHFEFRIPSFYFWLLAGLMFSSNYEYLETRAVPFVIKY